MFLKTGMFFPYFKVKVVRGVTKEEPLWEL